MLVFKSIKPGVKFKSSVFREEIRASAEKMAPQIKADFERTTRTWTHKPEFKTEVSIGAAAGGSLAGAVTGSATGASISVTTDDEVYAYVDEGTKKHTIAAKQGGSLVFPGTFRPKTQPGVIGSTAGSRGKRMVFAQVVHHPGTKPRKFAKTIHDKWQQPFRQEMTAAIGRAAKRSGHGVR